MRKKNKDGTTIKTTIIINLCMTYRMLDKLCCPLNEYTFQKSMYHTRYLCEQGYLLDQLYIEYNLFFHAKYCIGLEYNQDTMLDRPDLGIFLACTQYKSYYCLLQMFLSCIPNMCNFYLYPLCNILAYIENKLLNLHYHW